MDIGYVMGYMFGMAHNVLAPQPEKNQQNPPQVQKNEGIKVCKYCGHQYEPGETFCPDCGAVETEIKM